MAKKTTKTRKWFLTINQEAECFPVVKDILKNTDNLNYSMMLHDKDNEEQPHYHLVLEYVNARTFEAVHQKFTGAHIEQVEFMYKVCRYLLHLDDTDKYQYPIEELFTNCNSVEYYIENDEFQKLEQESLMDNISDGTIYNLSTAIKVYGLKQVNFYRNMILTLIEENKTTSLEARKINYETGYNAGYTEAEELYIHEIEMLKRKNQELQKLVDMYDNQNLLNF